MDQDWRDTFEGVLFDFVDAKHGMSWAGDKDTLALGGDGYGGPYTTKARGEKCRWWLEQLKTLKQNTVKWDPASKKHQTH
jgi:hypothetical protein